MNPLMWIKVGAAAAVLVLIYAGYWYIDHSGYIRGRNEVQAKFDKYKENINDQVEKAKADAAKVKLEQDAKFAKAQLDYDATRKQLAAALARLRKPQAVPRDGGVQVAGCSTDPMPAQTGNTGGTAPAIEVTAGACEGTEFYALALLDTLQCSRLIEFVKN